MLFRVPACSACGWLALLGCSSGIVEFEVDSGRELFHVVSFPGYFVVRMWLGRFAVLGRLAVLVARWGWPCCSLMGLGRHVPGWLPWSAGRLLGCAREGDLAYHRDARGFSADVRDEGLVG